MAQPNQAKKALEFIERDNAPAAIAAAQEEALNVVEDNELDFVAKDTPQLVETLEKKNIPKADPLSDDEEDLKKDADLKKDDVMNIVDGDERSPWALEHVGIQVQYFSVGVIYAGSVSILYPILVIQQGTTTSFFTAAINLVTLFWSYKFLFGVLSDCFPVFGYKKKPYIILGWILCASMLIVLAGMGENVGPTTLVLMLTVANLGYVMANVTADGYTVWLAHREPTEKRGNVQTLIYSVREVGRLLINIVIIFAFSGPNVSCPGFEEDESVPCTTDESVTSRNPLFEELPETWCYQKCDAATFNFGLSIPQYMWIIATVNVVSIPAYFLLYEEKTIRTGFVKMMRDFWVVMRRRAVWQIMLYSMVSSITFNVFVSAKSNANFVWLGLSNLQNQGVNIVESLIFFTGLSMIWRKLVWIGKLTETFFQLLYLLISTGVYRNAWFYMFTDISATFIYSLNFMASTFAIVEVSEPGFEAITYALVTTANNVVIPLSSVISYQFNAFMPALNTQEGLAADTPSVRGQFTSLIIIVELINLTSLLSLPLLPRQKQEARDIVEKGETSTFWALFALISGLIFLIYSSVITFMTVAGADTYGCYKILGGAGCTDDESDVPVYLLIAFCFLYCYGVNFFLTFLPMIKGEKEFSFGLFF